MCGIIGYVGSNGAVQRALAGLRRFEPRGYDATGIGLTLPDGSGFRVVKSVGATGELRKALAAVSLPSRTPVVIGHTRWATHGARTQVNGHPHVSSSGRTMGVHNGTIHNHAELREWLGSCGYTFTSETDSEVIMSLIDEARDRLSDVPPMQAMRDALARLQGTWALVVCFADHPEEVYVATNGSSLVVGFGEGDMFVGSEPAGLFSETERFVRFQDGECARVTRDGLFDQVTLAGEAWERPIEIIRPRIKNEPSRPPGRHSMHFEIDQTPTVLRAMLDGFGAQLDGEAGQKLETSLRAGSVRRLLLTGCGSAFHAAQFAEALWSTECPFEVRARLASNGGLKGLKLNGEHDVLLAVSQSGTTYDTIQAVRQALANALRVFALVNEAHVTLDALSCGALYTDAGLEDGVAATKTFVLQCAALLALAIRCGGAPDSDWEALQELPGQLAKVIVRLEGTIRDRVAPQVAAARTVFVLGQEAMVPMAYEGALKLQEVARSLAVGLPMGELKHGPLALLDEQAATIMLASDDDELRKSACLTLSEMRSCKHGPIIVVCSVQSAGFYRDIADHVLVVPNANPRLLPLLHVVVMQLLAYHAGVIQGLNPDRPVNLAKTVTVG